ncbi:MAG: invasion associated locus B family protein [Pararhodobacter sp.]
MPLAAQDTRPDSLRETFNDWIVQCQPSDAAPGGESGGESGGQMCEMVQQIDHQQSGQRVLAFSIRPGTTGADPVAVMILPFGLRLSEGVTLREGDAVVATFGFDTCLAGGCVVIAPLDAPMVDRMRRGASISVVMTTRNGGSVGVPVSLSGFSRAMDRLAALAGA